MACEHNSRFSGVFDLPRDCGGCLACHAEKLAAENALFRGDKWTDAEIAEMLAAAGTGVTATEINTLPLRVKSYIHDLETNADPAGTIQELALLKDQTRQLDAVIARLKLEFMALQKKYTGAISAWNREIDRDANACLLRAARERCPLA